MVEQTECRSDCCEDPGCPCVKQCDERHCEVHRQEEEAKWAAHFGLRPGMSRVQRLQQLEAFRPTSDFPFTLED